MENIKTILLMRKIYYNIFLLVTACSFNCVALKEVNKKDGSNSGGTKIDN